MPSYRAPSIINNTEAASAGSTSINLAIPSGYQEGDLLLAVGSNRSVNGCVIGGGFTEYMDFDGGVQSLVLAWKEASASESTIQVTQGSSVSIWAAMICIRYAQIGSDPIVTHYWDIEEASANYITCPTQSSTTDNSLAMSFGGMQYGYSGFVNNYGGWTNGDNWYTGTSTGMSAGWAYKAIATAGASGEGRFTSSSGNANGVGATAIIAGEEIQRRIFIS